MDFDFQNNRTNASTLLANYHIGQVTIGGGDAIYRFWAGRKRRPSNLADIARFNQFRGRCRIRQCDQARLQRRRKFRL